MKIPKAIMKKFGKNIKRIIPQLPKLKVEKQNSHIILVSTTEKKPKHFHTKYENIEAKFINEIEENFPILKLKKTQNDNQNQTKMTKKIKKSKKESKK